MLSTKQLKELSSKPGFIAELKKQSRQNKNAFYKTIGKNYLLNMVLAERRQTGERGTGRSRFFLKSGNVEMRLQGIFQL